MRECEFKSSKFLGILGYCTALNSVTIKVNYIRVLRTVCTKGDDRKQWVNVDGKVKMSKASKHVQVASAIHGIKEALDIERLIGISFEG